MSGAEATEVEIGIFEVLFMTEEIRAMALKQASTSEIRRLAIQLGMKSLREDGWRKVAAGLTTVEEVVRLTQEDENVKQRQI